MSEHSNAAARDSQSEAANGHTVDGAATTQDLDKKFQDLEAQLKEKDAKYLYLYAEFENYKKRAIKERSDAMKFGWENAARELVEVIDNIERALSHIAPETDKNLVAGLHMTLNQFRAVLQKQGVTHVESVGQVFNPELHDAIGQEPSDKPEGVIAREHLKGYTLHGRLLRPASVVISTGRLAN